MGSTCWSIVSAQSFLTAPPHSQYRKTAYTTWPNQHLGVCGNCLRVKWGIMVLLWLVETSQSGQPVKMASLRLHPWAALIIKIDTIGRTKQKLALFELMFLITFCHYKFSNDPSFETLTTLFFCVTLRSPQCHVSLLTMDTLCSQPGWHETLRRTCSIYYIFYITYYLLQIIYYIIYIIFYISYVIYSQWAIWHETLRRACSTLHLTILLYNQTGCVLKWISHRVH